MTDPVLDARRGLAAAGDLASGYGEEGLIAAAILLVGAEVVDALYAVEVAIQQVKESIRPEA